MTDTGVAQELGKVQTDLPEAGNSLVLEGELPGSYMEAGSNRCRIYTPRDSRTEPIGSIRLTKEQAETLGLHSGVRYKLILEPIPPTKSQK